MSDVLTFFSQAGPIMEPGPYARILDNLPVDIGELCRVVQGFTIHIFWAERYGLSLTEDRKAEVQLRNLQRRLVHTLELDSRSLMEARPLEKKLVGNCRDFSVLLVYPFCGIRAFRRVPAAGLGHILSPTTTKITGCPSIGIRNSRGGSWWMPN